MPEIRYAKSGGVQIAYAVSGDGPIDLIFVPGFVSHLEGWDEEPGFVRMKERLLSFSRVIMFDRRGMGLSDRGEVSTLESTIDDMRAVLDAVGSERAAILAVSEGGPAAALFAATYPERTAALVIWGSFARLVDAPDYPLGLPASTLSKIIDAMAESWGGPAGAALFAPSKAEDVRFNDWWARALRMGMSPSGVRPLMQMYDHIDVRNVLPSITAPSLVLHRSGDLVASVEWGRYLAERIPRSRFVEIPGRDHLIWTENVDEIMGEIEEFLTGERPAPERDRVLATVLFTDIVDSTARAAEAGDSRWREVIGRHDDLVRRALHRFHGREIKTTGDGFLATFDGPARAIRCAKVVTEGAGALGIEVRAGLHTGEIELIGTDIGGIAVTIASRVADEAAGGEVVVSQTVRDLVAGSGIGFAERGLHELKGVPDEWRLYSVKEGI